MGEFIRGIEKEWVGRKLVTVNLRFFANSYTPFPLGCFERKLINFECFESNVTAQKHIEVPLIYVHHVKFAETYKNASCENKNWKSCDIAKLAINRYC